jgi:hypothetical protein
LNKKVKLDVNKKLPIENRQYIYTPRFLDSPEKNNRSFAGYLFGELGKKYIL